MHWFLKGLRTPHGAVTAVSGPVTTDWKTSTPLDCITVGLASHRLILTRCHFSHVSLFLCWDKNGTAKLRRISHIKHVFRLFGLIPHCDVCYSVNTYENKEKRSNEKLHPNFLFFFFKYIFVFIRQMQWKLTGKWERDTGTPAHPAAPQVCPNWYEQGLQVRPKETSMGVNKQTCPNEDAEDSFLCWTRLFGTDLFLHVTHFIPTEIFPPQCYFFQELVTLEFSYEPAEAPLNRINNVRKMRGERFLLMALCL